MSQHLCFFVPPHVLAHIARAQAREGLEPSAAQRSAVISTELRAQRQRAGRSLTTGAARPALADGLGAPASGSAGRLIYDDQNTSNFDVQLVRAEGDPAVPGDNANRAYDYLGEVRSFYQDVLGRNSIDGAGLNLLANVNYETNYDNAFWDGQRMVFGNGDNVIFRDFTLDIDVAGHELTHGVTQYAAGLQYTDDQTGALNESFSDMMGSAIDALSEAHDAGDHDWLIGEGIMAEGLYGEALRNMKEPGTAYDDQILGRDPQPRDMSGYHEPADPHLMSGIPNRWFYLVCSELGIRVGALIMYQTLQQLWPTAKFSDAAEVASAQARLLSRDKLAPPQSAHVVRSAARAQGFW